MGLGAFGLFVILFSFVPIFVLSLVSAILFFGFSQLFALLIKFLSARLLFLLLNLLAASSLAFKGFFTFLNC